MWGSNCREYIQEARRILESIGKLYIIEPTKRWSELEEHGAAVHGSKLRQVLEDAGFHIIESSIGKFSLFICI
jgi:tRNA1(Val) A37 N6-methylase TrmN6